MTESDSSVTSSRSEIVIGINIGISPCRVSVWNGYGVEILEDTIRQIINRSCEYHESTFFKMKQLMSINFHQNEHFPYLIHTLDNKVRPFIAPFVDKMFSFFPPASEILLGRFMFELRHMVETHLKRPVRNVVFTIPVSLSRLQLSRIHRACRMAGLKIIRVMPQPTAVALLYAYQQKMALLSSPREDMDRESEKIALIFNMDSGYCDVAIIATKNGKCRMKAFTGSNIGGEDLLENMMCYFLPDQYLNVFKKKFHDDRDIKCMALFRGETEEMITLLSNHTICEGQFDIGNGFNITKVITREEFEEINKEVFEKCERLIIQCLLDAKIEVGDINDVIIVGSCCNIPKVKNIVTKICKGKKIYNGMNPLDAALCGAAMTGAIALGNGNPFGKLEMFDLHVTLSSFGIRANGNKFEPIIWKNTAMSPSEPMTKHMAGFTTIRDNQTAALIAIYEGEAMKAEENHLLGYFIINEIPRAPKGTPKIYVTMAIDNKNMLTVMAYVTMPRSHHSSVPVTVTRITSFTEDGEYGWRDESLIRAYGDEMDLVRLNFMELE